MKKADGDPGVGMGAHGCTHVGTVWQIESPVAGTTGPTGLWECTRCGRLWRREPDTAASPGADA